MVKKYLGVGGGEQKGGGSLDLKSLERGGWGYLDLYRGWVIQEGKTNFIEPANNHNPTIKFTAEISDTETNFSDTTVYKGERFLAESVLNVRTHFKPTETFQYRYVSMCQPSGVKRGFSYQLRP